MSSFLHIHIESYIIISVINCLEGFLKGFLTSLLSTSGAEVHRCLRVLEMRGNSLNDDCMRVFSKAFK